MHFCQDTWIFQENIIRKGEKRRFIEDATTINNPGQIKALETRQRVFGTCRKDPVIGGVENRTIYREGVEVRNRVSLRNFEHDVSGKRSSLRRRTFFRWRTIREIARGIRHRGFGRRPFSDTNQPEFREKILWKSDGTIDCW